MLIKRLMGASLMTAIVSTSANLAADTRVVTSIKPLELLVKAVATDGTQVESLVPSGSSPHTYTMRPSQRRALAASDLVFWVGPGLETFLARLLEGDEFSHRTVTLLGEAEEDEKHHDDHHDSDHHEGHEEEHAGHGHGHDHGEGNDPHIWLDPALALEMAHTIHQALSAQPGADKPALDRNLARLEEQLKQAEADIRQKLQPLADISLFSYHDAFQRFADHYGLKLDGVLTLNPEISPGARHVSEVQALLRKATRPCLLTEPQFQREWWRSITQGIDVTVVTWDPLASEIPSDRDGYVRFQQNIADKLRSCLPEQA